MGMYDEVRAINVSHENFDSKHNNLTFQTKDLECEMFEYCLFNNDLYIEAERGGDGYVRHDKAIKSDYSGSARVYTDYTRNKVEYWIEYDLTFENGALVDVVARGKEVRKDHRDLSNNRPNKPSNRVMIEINILDCDDDKKQAVTARLTDEKIAAIRELLEEPLATVSYPINRSENTDNGFLMAGFGFGKPYINILSVVQTLEDFEVNEDTGQATITAPSGDIIILDEFHNLGKR